MSRGGRGGFRGGKIGGAEVPWAYDPDIKPDYKPSELFPVREIRPSTSTGEAQIGANDGYACRWLSSLNQQVSRRENVCRWPDFAHSAVVFTKVRCIPFWDPVGWGSKEVLGPRSWIPSRACRRTRTDTGRKPERCLGWTHDLTVNTENGRVSLVDGPLIRALVLEFFPKELWSTLDPDHAKENGPEAASRNQSKKILKLSRPSLEKELFDDDVDDDEEMDADDADDAHLESPKRTSRRSKGGDEDEDDRDKAAGDNALDDEDQEGDEEEVDDDFEENEEEMGEDYNAEAYFQDGRDDDGDDYDGGGGDDDGGYM